MGGIRASLSKGNVTRGDILDIAPFENKICFLTLSGTDVMELFAQMAMVGGEGVSHSIRLEISKDGKLLSASINGKPVDPNASYRITTIDYLAQGNDHLEAFKKKTNFVSPQNEENNARFLIEEYFKDMHAEGKAVEAKVEGRQEIRCLNLYEKAITYNFALLYCHYNVGSEDQDVGDSSHQRYAQLYIASQP